MKNELEITKNILIKDALKHPFSYDCFQVSNNLYSMKCSFGILYVNRGLVMILFPFREIKIKGYKQGINSIKFNINQEEYNKLIMIRK